MAVFVVNGMIATKSCFLSTGPLNTSKEVKTSEGASAVLTCFLPAPSKLPITGGFWTYKSISDIRISTLTKSQNAIKWNTTDVGSKRVKLSNNELKTDFSVTLEKVKNKNVSFSSFKSDPAFSPPAYSAVQKS